MRVNSITSVKFNNYKHIEEPKSSESQTFKGYVNGKYYADEIIKEAKNAFKNPNWKEKFLRNKKNFQQTIATWHEHSEVGSKGARALLGILTLGISEVTYGLAYRGVDMMDNNSIDRKIEEIKNCIDDIIKIGGPDKV